MLNFLKTIYFIALLAITCTVQAQIWTASDNCFSISIYDTVTKKKYTYPKSQLQVHDLGSQLQLQRVNPSPSIIASWTASNIGLLAPTISQGYDLISGWLVNTCALTSGGNDSLQNLILNGDTLSITGGNSVILPANGGGGLWDTTTVLGEKVLFSPLMNVFGNHDYKMILKGTDTYNPADTFGIPVFYFSGEAEDSEVFSFEGETGDNTALNINVTCSSAIYPTIYLKASNLFAGGPEITISPAHGQLVIEYLNEFEGDFLLSIDNFGVVSKVPVDSFRNVQRLDLNGDTLSITGGNSVILPASGGVIQKAHFSFGIEDSLILRNLYSSPVTLVSADTNEIVSVFNVSVRFTTGSETFDERCYVGFEDSGSNLTLNINAGDNFSFTKYLDASTDQMTSFDPVGKSLMLVGDIADSTIGNGTLEIVIYYTITKFGQ